VFISYGGCDSEFARRLAKDIEAAGIRIWFAEWDLDYGDDVVQEIETGLDDTRQFIIILSPEGIKKTWVRKELSVAFQQALSGAGKAIIPVMYKKVQPPGFVGTQKWIDFTDPNRYEAQVSELIRRLKGRRKKRT
jgi:hypothetical protein